MVPQQPAGRCLWPVGTKWLVWVGYTGGMCVWQLFASTMHGFVIWRGTGLPRASCGVVTRVLGAAVCAGAMQTVLQWLIITVTRMQPDVRLTCVALPTIIQISENALIASGHCPVRLHCIVTDADTILI